MSSSPTFGCSSLHVATGGAFRARLRSLTGRLWLAAVGPVAATSFPWATLLVERGALGMAAIYVGTALVAGFAALFGGLWLMRVTA